MSVSGSPFCEHKKIRSSCPLCKAALLQEQARTHAADPLRATPYTATHEREDEAEKKAAKPRQAKPNKPTGPGKPLMPTRKAKTKVTAEDEAKAEAWWVPRK